MQNSSLGFLHKDLCSSDKLLMGSWTGDLHRRAKPGDKWKGGSSDVYSPKKKRERERERISGKARMNKPETTVFEPG